MTTEVRRSSLSTGFFYVRHIAMDRPSYLRPALVLLSCFLPSLLAAQISSTIQGTVTDQQGLAIVAATIRLENLASIGGVEIATNAAGTYRIPGLSAGTYLLRVSKSGFETRVYQGLVLTVNSQVTIDVVLDVAARQEEIAVSALPTLLDEGVSSTSTTIRPEEIAQMPINGRNYLDLMQLVPGIAINRQADAGTDAAVPILGERGGNAVFLIDGMPNTNAVEGGAAALFQQDSILEFQVLTTGYTAEFGHGSGGIVNVLSKGGTNQWHGLASAFYRNNVLDSSDVSKTDAPFLQRWDPGVNAGGPLLKDRVFLFGSLERIRESRELNFSFPPGIPPFLQTREEGFDQHNQTYETRGFGKLDEQIGRHQISEEFNLINSHVTNFLPLSQAISLPSTRTDSDSRDLMLGLHDTVTIGSRNNPFLLSAFVQYRGEPFAERAAHPEASSATTVFNLFSSLTTGKITGDQGQVEFGAGFTPLLLQPRYVSLGTHANRAAGKHEIKFGWDFQNIAVSGTEASNLFNQLFATTSDFTQFGPTNSGVYVLTKVAGPTPVDNALHLSNNYDGLFVQDDWKFLKALTLNLGLRWDYDSRFPNNTDFSPRLGAAWSPDSKTVISANWGVFYDNFRLGLARDVPGFGGANLFRNQTISFPRLFYGDPTIFVRFNGICPSTSLTDAQIASSGAACPVPGLPFYGIDHLNSVVASGHAPISANAVVTQDNVQSLTGLTAQQFADAASAAVAHQPGFFFWGGFGNLTMNFAVPRIFTIPVTVDPGFKTPFTRAFHVGAQRELTANTLVEADYYHRDVRDMSGVRITNLAFEARLPGHAGELQPGTGTRPILSYGPWYEGQYDGISVGFRKRMSKRFNLEAFYTWANDTDNALNSSLVSEVQTGLGAGFLAAKGPTDSFVGVPPVVTDRVSGKTNTSGPFIASNGSPVPQAGKFYNGANVDRGPSDLAVNHTFLVHGTVQLPWQFSASAIFRAQSGFHFSAISLRPVDVDGDGLLDGVDTVAGRNHFQAPAYVNVDARFSKRFTVSERVHLETMFEFFNLLNRANPAAVEQLQNILTPLGQPLQFLPGREGQVGLRIEF